MSRVLIAEDEPRIAAFIEKGLRANGYATTVVADGLSALDRARNGEADLVVGTHAILSEGVAFARLGLAVIDEQHRFGVRQRGALAEKGASPHLLVMSATPIPRTLSMAMSGIRDMSTIEEPPFERQPVETFVLEYNEVILAEAIKKELARGGQVYYLHNDVASIERGRTQGPLFLVLGSLVVGGALLTVLVASTRPRQN